MTSNRTPASARQTRATSAAFVALLFVAAGCAEDLSREVVWEEAVTFNYDSITMNPPIDPAGKKDGAVSGIVPFKAGDKLKFSCFVDNTSNATVTSSNELQSGEMCNLWGSTIGGGLADMPL